MDMPSVAPRLPATGALDGSYTFERTRGTQASATCGVVCSTGTHALVIEMGHMTPDSVMYLRRRGRGVSAARTQRA